MGTWEAANTVTVEGKITRLDRVRYTPAGDAVFEFELGVPQDFFGKRSVGYFSVALYGSGAEDASGSLRIGTLVEVQGRLLGRRYKNARGERVSEVKILANHCELRRKP